MFGLRGEAATPSTDIYAFGCVVYECITGTPPFGGKSLFEIGTAHLKVSPPDPGETRVEVTPSLSWALLKALEKDPVQRPPTATAFASLLHVAAGRR